MNFHYLIEWQFNALLISIFFYVICRFGIKNHFIKHRTFQFGFVILMLLPLISFLIHNNRSSLLFNLYEIKSQPAEINNLELTAGPKAAVEVTNAVTTAAPAVSMNIENIFLIALCVYLALAILLFMKHYCQLYLYCRMLPNYKHGIASINSKVLSSEHYSTPFCFGFIKPAIIIPASMTDEEEVNISIMHESAHIKNRDPQFICLQYFVKVMYFWNPLIWFMDQQFNETQEILADYKASDDLGNSQHYAETLVNLVKRSRNKTIPLCTSGMASKKRQLLTRLNAILKENENMKKSIPVWKKAGLCLALTVSSSAILATGLVAEEKTIIRELPSAPAVEKTADKEDLVNQAQDKVLKEVKLTIISIYKNANANNDNAISKEERAAARAEIKKLNKKLIEAKANIWISSGFPKNPSKVKITTGPGDSADWIAVYVK